MQAARRAEVTLDMNKLANSNIETLITEIRALMPQVTPKVHALVQSLLSKNPKFDASTIQSTAMPAAKSLFRLYMCYTLGRGRNQDYFDALKMSMNLSPGSQSQQAIQDSVSAIEPKLLSIDLGNVPGMAALYNKLVELSKAIAASKVQHTEPEPELATKPAPSSPPAPTESPEQPTEDNLEDVYTDDPSAYLIKNFNIPHTKEPYAAILKLFSDLYEHNLGLGMSSEDALAVSTIDLHSKLPAARAVEIFGANFPGPTLVNRVEQIKNSLPTDTQLEVPVIDMDGNKDVRLLEDDFLSEEILSDSFQDKELGRAVKLNDQINVSLESISQLAELKKFFGLNVDDGNGENLRKLVKYIPSLADSLDHLQHFEYSDPEGNKKYQDAFGDLSILLKRAQESSVERDDLAAAAEYLLRLNLRFGLVDMTSAGPQSATMFHDFVGLLGTMMNEDTGLKSIFTEIANKAPLSGSKNVNSLEALHFLYTAGYSPLLEPAPGSKDPVILGDEFPDSSISRGLLVDEVERRRSQHPAFGLYDIVQPQKTRVQPRSVKTKNFGDVQFSLSRDDLAALDKVELEDAEKRRDLSYKEKLEEERRKKEKDMTPAPFIPLQYVRPSKLKKKPVAPTEPHTAPGPGETTHPSVDELDESIKGDTTDVVSIDPETKEVNVRLDNAELYQPIQSPTDDNVVNYLLGLNTDALYNVDNTISPAKAKDRKYKALAQTYAKLVENAAAIMGNQIIPLDGGQSSGGVGDNNKELSKIFVYESDLYTPTIEEVKGGMLVRRAKIIQHPRTKKPMLDIDKSNEAIVFGRLIGGEPKLIVMGVDDPYLMVYDALTGPKEWRVGSTVTVASSNNREFLSKYEPQSKSNARNIQRRNFIKKYVSRMAKYLAAQQALPKAIEYWKDKKSQPGITPNLIETYNNKIARTKRLLSVSNNRMAEFREETQQLLENSGFVLNLDGEDIVSKINEVSATLVDGMYELYTDIANTGDAVGTMSNFDKGINRDMSKEFSEK